MLAQSRVGRRRSTTPHDITDVAIELFAARGFDEVSVDDVAQAAGISRRTLFRYYASKNAILWGEFDTHLDAPSGTARRPSARGFRWVRRCGRHCWRSTPLTTAETVRHRERMRVILRDRGTAGILDDDVCRLA